MRCNYKQEDLDFLLIIHGNGEVYIEFDLKLESEEEDTTDRPQYVMYDNFLKMFYDIDTKKSVFGILFRRLAQWNNNLNFLYENKEINYVYSYLIIKNRIKKNFLHWVARCSPVIRYVGEKKTDIPNALLFTKYKRVSNYQKNIFDSIAFFIFNNKINRRDDKELQSELSKFLKEAYDKSDDEIESIIQEYKIKYMYRYPRYIKFMEGIDIILSKYGNNYKCYIESSELNDNLFKHCLFFVNGLFSIYFSDKWRNVSKPAVLGKRINESEEITAVQKSDGIFPNEFEIDRPFVKGQKPV
jgi:hypothetical protein